MLLQNKAILEEQNLVSRWTPLSNILPSFATLNGSRKKPNFIRRWEWEITVGLSLS